MKYRYTGTIEQTVNIGQAPYFLVPGGSIEVASGHPRLNQLVDRGVLVKVDEKCKSSLATKPEKQEVKR